MMAGFNATEWIAKPPQEVFEYTIDIDNAALILSNVTHAEMISNGAVGLGSRFRETRTMNGRATTSELEVTTFEPPHQYAATLEQSGIYATYLYTFRPEKNGTRVNLSAKVSANGVKKLMLPIVVSFMKKADGDHLQRLKHAVENGK